MKTTIVTIYSNEYINLVVVPDVQTILKIRFFFSGYANNIYHQKIKCGRAESYYFSICILKLKLGYNRESESRRGKEGIV